MSDESKVPNPGSDEAIEQGCTCSVLDNGHGNEQLGKERGFWIDFKCPLHAIKTVPATPIRKRSKHSWGNAFHRIEIIK